jgi:hypothetical protein
MRKRLPSWEALQTLVATQPQRAPVGSWWSRASIAGIGWLPLLVSLIASEGSTGQAGNPTAPAPAPARVSASQGGSRQNEGAAKTPVLLRILSTPGITPTAPNQGSHDFGQVSLLDRTEITQTFLLRNADRAPIVVERVKGSCGCTSAVVHKRGKEGAVMGATPPTTPPVRLAPGEEVSVRAVLDLTPLPAGSIRKTVSIYVQGLRGPAAVAEIRGTLLPNVTFTPSQANFGRLNWGEGKVLCVTATFDPRLTAAGPPPPLVSTNPAIRIEPLSGENKSTAPVPASGDTSGVPARTYQLSVEKNASLGPLDGEISFSPLTLAPSATGPTDRVAAALRSARLRVVGEVAGDVSAQPSVVSMGVVEKGRQAEYQIVLTGTTNAALEDLKIASDSTWLSARVDASPAGMIPGSTDEAAERTKVLKLHLAAGAPPGVFQSQLRIFLMNGQHLAIPVSAYVKPERSR